MNFENLFFLGVCVCIYDSITVDPGILLFVYLFISLLHVQSNFSQRMGGNLQRRFLTVSSIICLWLACLQGMTVKYRWQLQMTEC